ncbi:MAG: alpha-amylase family protein [Acidobacteriaceae bacterium]
MKSSTLFTRRKLLQAAAAAFPFAPMLLDATRRPQPAVALPLSSRPGDFARNSQPAPVQMERFFGVHFDLHPNQEDTALGRDVTDEMIDGFLKRVQPDFVQYDCKGHVGYLGYPSNVSTSAPGIVKDSLEIWRRATARHGVALLIHFSGVLDQLAVSQHPNWARVRPDGGEGKDRWDGWETSTFGPYEEERMVPQLKEAAAKYDLDGAWIDGDVWATKPDYCIAAACAFSQATGLQRLPEGPEDPGWIKFLEINRAQFRKYIREYVDAMHNDRPNFKIASNYLYSTSMPERPEIPTDFLSLDYGSDSPVTTVRRESRYLATNDRPWDVMAWGFQDSRNNVGGVVFKSSTALQQETAVALAQGGGVQIYYNPTRAGHIDNVKIELLGRASDFCRARRASSFQTETVPQVGVLFSKKSLYEKSNRLFGDWGDALDPATGVLDVLVENQYSVDFIPDWKIEVAAQYPFIVVPDWPDIGADVVARLTEYATVGGKLLIVGAENALLFSKSLGVRLEGTASAQDAYVRGEEVFGNISGNWQDVEPAGAETVEERYSGPDSTEKAKCAATLHNLGVGQIAAIYGPVGTAFRDSHAPATRQFIKRVVGRLFVPVVQVEGPPTVEIALRRRSGNLLLHLVNCTAMSEADDHVGIDFIPSIGPLRITIQTPRKPARVSLEPEGRMLAGAWNDGAWRGTVETLHIHNVVSVGL